MHSPRRLLANIRPPAPPPARKNPCDLLEAAVEGEEPGEALVAASELAGGAIRRDASVLEQDHAVDPLDVLQVMGDDHQRLVLECREEDVERLPLVDEVLQAELAGRVANLAVTGIGAVEREVLPQGRAESLARGVDAAGLLAASSEQPQRLEAAQGIDEMVGEPRELLVAPRRASWRAQMAISAPCYDEARSRAIRIRGDQV